jgi:hypothetical protein
LLLLIYCLLGILITSFLALQKMNFQRKGYTNAPDYSLSSYQ